MEQLIRAIMLQAVKDLEDHKFESDAKEFFKSNWFDALAEGLEMDPVSIREQVLANTYQRVNIRAGYR